MARAKKRINFNDTANLIHSYHIQIAQIQRLIETPLAGMRENHPPFGPGEDFVLGEEFGKFNPVNYEITGGEEGQIVRTRDVKFGAVFGEARSRFVCNVYFEHLKKDGKPYASERLGTLMFEFNPASPFKKGFKDGSVDNEV